MNEQPQRTTDAQRHHFWTSAQDTLASIAAQAERYLPDTDEDSDALDPTAVDEILNVLMQARASADTAAGAYGRVMRQITHSPEQGAATPPHGVQQGRRTYANGGW